jgi:hypothetical protein
MKPDLEDTTRQLLIDGYALASCAALLVYLISVLVL